MDRQRESQRMVVLSLLVAFALGAVFGALGSRRGLLSPRVALAPGLPEREDADDTVFGPDSVPGNGTAFAPIDYPVKGNERSGIYHLPGGFAYDRTVATIHFRTPEAAEAAGYRPAKA